MIRSIYATVDKKQTLKPVGHQSTNWIVRLVLMLAKAAWVSLGATSPRYNSAQATKIYFKCDVEANYNGDTYCTFLLGGHT